MDISTIPYDGHAAGARWGDLFFHPLFVNTAAELFHLRGEPVILSARGRQLFILNLLVHKVGPFRAATIPLLFQYFGAISDSTVVSSDDVVELDSYLAAHCDYAILSLPPGFTSDPLKRAGWKLKESSTLAIDEQGLRTWGDGFRDDVRNKIRKAEKSGVDVTGSDYLPTGLWVNSYTRKNIAPPLEPSLLARWCEKLMAGSLLRIFVARTKGAPVAFRGELIKGDYAYDWIAGSDPGHHALGANQILMREIGLQLARAGVRVWDLVGGDVKSIHDFKKSFGAKDVPHFQASRTFNLKGRAFSILRKMKYGRWY